VLEYRWAAENRLGDLPDLAIELVRLRVDVIVAQTTAHAQAAKRATSTIPIVMGSVSDPVGSGLVGNVTGSSLRAPELAAKLLDLLKEALPRASRITALGNPDNPGAVLSRREVEAAAQVLGLRLDVVDVGEAKDLDRAFQASTAAHTDAVIALPSPLFAVYRRRVAELALKNRLPTVSFETGFAEAGGLMSYGPNVPDMHRRAATYVDKILKGAKPADLPVEQPTKFELVINLKTAKALGLTIPPAVLARADEIIE
jgi:putative tryptophan/tyrosine transport system substrate-binding protein